MDCEINIDSICVLEEQIRKHEKAAIRLKRVRNSLLNVSRLPPEVLSKVFHWNVTLKDDFDRLGKRSHNFLLVCHHWFEVASRASELWSFWGNSLKDWARWCHRSGSAPLDLVLGDYDYYNVDNDYYYGGGLQDELRNRATRDSIRCVHLMANGWGILRSIIGRLTTDHGEPRSIGIESFILLNQDTGPTSALDVSDFFAHYRFPKLQRLHLFNCRISSWDLLTSRTSTLTTLVLNLTSPSPTSTMPQLLSILFSNPTLQKVTLGPHAVPNSGGDETSFRVQLHHLKELELEERLRPVIRLLDHLDHPRNLDLLSLILHDSDVTDVSQTIGPYLRGHFQRRDRPQSGLSLHVSSGESSKYRGYHIGFQAGDAGEIDFSAPTSVQTNPFVTIAMLLSGTPDRNMLGRAVLDLIAYAPLEEAVYLHACSNPIIEDTRTRFPNLRTLSFDKMFLSAAFPNPDLIVDRKILPSLEYVLLKDVVADEGDWTPLTTFLARRVSSGNQMDTLVITGFTHVCRQVVEDLRDMVRELKINRQFLLCHLAACQGP